MNTFWTFSHSQQVWFFPIPHSCWEWDRIFNQLRVWNYQGISERGCCCGESESGTNKSELHQFKLKTCPLYAMLHLSVFCVFDPCRSAASLLFKYLLKPPLCLPCHLFLPSLMEFWGWAILTWPLMALLQCLIKLCLSTSSKKKFFQSTTAGVFTDFLCTLSYKVKSLWQGKHDSQDGQNCSKRLPGQFFK